MWPPEEETSRTGISTGLWPCTTIHGTPSARACASVSRSHRSWLPTTSMCTSPSRRLNSSRLTNNTSGERWTAYAESSHFVPTGRCA
jgi:hypothetical protein